MRSLKKIVSILLAISIIFSIISVVPVNAASSALKEGSTGDRVKALQCILNYYIEKKAISGSLLTVDGKFGSATTKAVKAVQKAAKLTQDGIVGEKTANALITNLPVQSKGSKSNNMKLVIAIQGMLNNKRNSKYPALEPDGIFGADTENAVKIFQKAAGIKVDGKVGYDTWKKLLS